MKERTKKKEESIKYKKVTGDCIDILCVFISAFLRLRNRFRSSLLYTHLYTAGYLHIYKLLIRHFERNNIEGLRLNTFLLPKETPTYYEN